MPLISSSAWPINVHALAEAGEVSHLPEKEISTSTNRVHNADLRIEVFSSANKIPADPYRIFHRLENHSPVSLSRVSAFHSASAPGIAGDTVPGATRSTMLCGATLPSLARNSPFTQATAASPSRKLNVCSM